MNDVILSALDVHNTFLLQHWQGKDTESGNRPEGYLESVLLMFVFPRMSPRSRISAAIFLVSRFLMHNRAILRKYSEKLRISLLYVNIFGIYRKFIKTSGKQSFLVLLKHCFIKFNSEFFNFIVRM